MTTWMNWLNIVINIIIKTTEIRPGDTEEGVIKESRILLQEMDVLKMTILETVQVCVIHAELCLIIAGVMFAQTI